MARLTAQTLPQRPGGNSQSSRVRSHADPETLPDLPVGLPAGLDVATHEDLVPAATRALGEINGRALLTMLDTAPDSIIRSTRTDEKFHAFYPYRYAALDEILASASGPGWDSGATALGAALIELAAIRETRASHYDVYRYPDAAAAAYAVLDRRRATGDCEAQLDVLFLVTANRTDGDQYRIVREETSRTLSLCPDDTAPLWLLGTYQSQREYPWDGPGDPPEEAKATFARLVREHPASVAALTGAADAHLRAGIWLADHKPFVARNEFRAAVTGYTAARSLGAASDVAPGLARALIGLGDPARAAGMLRPLVSSSTTPGPLLELLVLADESAHDFTAAESDARRLHETRQYAFPEGPAFYPAPRGRSYLVEPRQPEPSGALSRGVGRLATLTTYLYQEGGKGGGAVEDLSFIPTYRRNPSTTDSNPRCTGWTWLRDAILAGHAATAASGLAAADDGGTGYRCTTSRSTASDTAFRTVLRAEAGGEWPSEQQAAADLNDDRQNLWRWAGDLPRAEAVIRGWAGRYPADPLPRIRLGEVEYLTKRYDDAAADFDVAARLIRNADYRNDLGVEEAMLDRCAALIAAGRTGEAMPALRTIADQAIIGVSRNRGAPSWYLYRFAAVVYYAHQQLADRERESGAVRAAAEDYQAALEMLPLLEGTGVRPEALYNNSAIAELALRRFDAAEDAAGRALAADPANPVFLMTAAYCADRSAHPGTAVRHNTDALHSDGGMYPAANDLGVELARRHRDTAAATAFRSAVGARPDYALGWFNLGVLYARMGPSHLLESQGALAQAFTLDPKLRDRKRRLTLDSTTYRTGLDLSKPLPPGWSFARSQRRSPATSVGILALMVLAVGLVRARGTAAAGGFADQWLEPAGRFLDRVPLVNRVRRPWWAVAATTAVFLLPHLFRGNVGATGVAAFGLGVLGLTLVAVRTRVVTARRDGLATRQEAWGPGVLFGLGLGAVGAPWAPLPVLRAPEDSRRARLAAPVVLCLLGGLLLLESAVTRVPVSESLGVAALVMAASTLLPVPPLDGARLGTGGLMAGTGIIATAVIIGVGLA